MVSRYSFGRRLPSRGAIVDRGHPLAQGLVMYVAGGIERTLGVPVAPGASCVVGAPSPSGGEGVYISSTSGAATLPGLFRVESIATQFTIAALATVPGNTTFEGLLSLPYNASWSNPYSLFFRGNTAGYEVGVPHSGGASLSTVVLSGIASRRHVVHMAIRDAANVQIWAGGVPVGSTSSLTANAASWSATRRDVVIGNTFPGNAEAAVGTHAVTALWNRALSATEAEWFSREPYALLVAPRRFVVSVPGGLARLGRSYLGIGTSATVAIRHDAIARVPVAGLAASTVTPTRGVAVANPVAPAPKATATPTRVALAVIHAAPTITPSASVAREVAAIVAAGGVFLGNATVTVSATARNIVAIYANKGGTAAVILGTLITASDPGLITWREPRIMEATL